MSQFEEAFHQLDVCLTRRMEVFHTPALVTALTDRSRSIRVSALGLSSLETREPVRTDHLFAIGSIGKSFTALAILQAQEAHLLDLHAPVKEYLRWFEVCSASSPITTHHLLTHSSGLPRGTDFSPDPRAEVYGLRVLSTGFAPGTHFWYSDLGYKVLGLVLEAVTGLSYAEAVRRQILLPLEMGNTFAATTSALRPRMAAGYRPLYDDRPYSPGQPLVPAHWVETNSGDGCIVSSAEDMAKFARMFLNEGRGPHGRILSAAGYRRMVSPMIEQDGETYGYGLYLFEDEGYQMAGHGGDVPGYESYLWLDLSNGLGAVTLMSTPYTPRASFITLEAFRAAYLRRQMPENPPIPNFTHIPDPQPYTGSFQDSQGTLCFEAMSHHLFLVDGDQRILLEERGKDSFYAGHPDWNLFLLNFGRDPQGRIVEVTYGPRWLTNTAYQGPRAFETPDEWQAFAGHYRSYNPWETNFRVFSRQGKLILCAANGDEEILVPLADGRFRIGEEDYVPDTIAFEQVVEGRALRAVRSNCPYYRFFTP